MTDSVAKSVPKSVLVDLQVFIMNGNDWVWDGFCDGICF